MWPSERTTSAPPRPSATAAAGLAPAREVMIRRLDVVEWNADAQQAVIRLRRQNADEAAVLARLEPGANALVELRPPDADRDFDLLGAALAAVGLLLTGLNGGVDVNNAAGPVTAETVKVLGTLPDGGSVPLDEKGVALFASPLMSSVFIDRITKYLEDQLSPTTSIHGVLSGGAPIPAASHEVRVELRFASADEVLAELKQMVRLA